MLALQALVAPLPAAAAAAQLPQVVRTAFNDWRLGRDLLARAATAASARRGAFGSSSKRLY